MNGLVQFETDRGQAVPAVTREQMQALDRVAVEQTGPCLLQMMEHAGRSLASLIVDIAGHAWTKRRIVVLAGGGGNGGGGICAARHLANHGGSVALALPNGDRLGDAARRQLHILRATSAELVDLDGLAGCQPHLVVDALIGYGLEAEPSGPIADAIRWADRSGSPIVALDVPSGVDATSGGTRGVFVRPRSTLTLALPKTGLRRARTGELFLADLGIPDEAHRRIGLPGRPAFGGRFRIRLIHSPVSIEGCE